MLSILVEVSPGDEFIREPHACLGVDIQTPGDAPGRKGVRIDIDFLEGAAVTAEVVNGVLGNLEPLIVSWGKPIPVGAPSL